jgi:hypothetical protein
MRRPLALGLAIALVIAVAVGALAVSMRSDHDDRAGGSQIDPGEGSATHADGESEGGEEGEEGDRDANAEERIQAFLDARRAGTLGKTSTINVAAAAGWAGEHLTDATADDWEPAVAADPAAPYVYLLVTRYGVTYDPSICRGGKCPDPAIVLRVSSDGGATFGPDRFLCGCKGAGGQFDPIIEVVPGTGAVYALWMNDFNVVFSKSTNHGQTWSTPVPTWGKVSWNDKPIVAVSDDGRDVYASWNGPTGGDGWVAQSHDAGATWTQTKVIDDAQYHFAYDGDVLPNGTVAFVETGVSYTGPGASAEGQTSVRVITSTNRGATWSTTLVDSVELGQPCESDGCYADFYDAHAALSADGGGNLVVVYDGATTSGDQSRVWSRRSTNGGTVWSARTQLSSGAEQAITPAVESTGSGQVRAWYYETNGGTTSAWNVWFRSSSDGGSTWTAPVKISDATSGTHYKSASGFLETYGDYGEIAITSTGKVFAAWGEGESYIGPGGVWYNRQT